VGVLRSQSSSLFFLTSHNAEKYKELRRESRSKRFTVREEKRFMVREEIQGYSTVF
jgi:hypothetical protein